MDPYERMDQLVGELAIRCPKETDLLLEALRQSIVHPSSSLVSLALFVARDKSKLGHTNAVCMLYILKALEGARNQQFHQVQQFLQAAESLMGITGKDTQ